MRAGHEVVVYDNLVNSSRESLRRVEALTGSSLTFFSGDLLDRTTLDDALAKSRPDAVIHFAGLKSVGESSEKPLRYYENNVGGTLNLIRSMEAHDLRKIVFSSSATVYGDSQPSPLHEDSVLEATNPYGRTKLFAEHILQDVCAADTRWSAAVLRYFNPVGAHESGHIGEDPRGTPNNLLPFVAQVAVGRLEKIQVFGADYPTADGTGVRDYIHVMDLAEGHLAALDYITSVTGIFTWNLGTGRGTSVLQVIRAFSCAAGKPLPYSFVARRPGDAATSYADPSSARAELGWSATRDLAQMCEDHWRWQKLNPNGYQSSGVQERRVDPRIHGG